REALIATVLTDLMILLFLRSWRNTLIIAVTIIPVCPDGEGGNLRDDCFVYPVANSRTNAGDVGRERAGCGSKNGQFGTLTEPRDELRGFSAECLSVLGQEF